MGTVDWNGMEFKSNVLCKSIASKSIQPDMKYIWKYAYGKWQLGLWWM